MSECFKHQWFAQKSTTADVHPPCPYCRTAELKYWLQWCLDNCDDSPEYNFGTDATEKMLTLLRGHKSG